MKKLITVFFKLLFGIWWVVGGIMIVVVPFQSQNDIVCVIAIIVFTIWLALSGTWIYYSNEKWMKEKQEGE